MIVAAVGGALALLALVAPAGAWAAPAASHGGGADRIHQIQSGDTLSAIARRYGVTVSSIVVANRLRSATARLKVGSRLTIPDAAATPVAATQADRPGTRRVRRAAALATTPMNLVLAVPDFVELPPGFAWPIEGSLSSMFGRRRNGWHRGIDIMAPPGTAVLAAAPGLVIASGVEPRYGRVVKLAHENAFVTVYAHNDDNLVELGQWVTAGQRIATVGRTGRATSEHLHFEIRHEGRAYNPLYLLPLPPRIVQIEEQVTDEDDDDE